MTIVAFPSRVGKCLVSMKVDMNAREFVAEIFRTLWEYNPRIQSALNDGLSQYLQDRLQRNKIRRTTV